MKATHRHQTTRNMLRSIALGLTLAMVASSAGAALFTITLTNGTSFETRYRPVESDWDDSQVMVMTDTGNWISLMKSEIEDVESRAEISGYGFQLNTSTLFLGWSPNDVVDDEAEEGEDGGKKPPSDSKEDERPLEYGDEGEATDFTFEQFLDVPEEGQGLGGGISLESEVGN